jgi:hypothetical protein
MLLRFFVMHIPYKINKIWDMQHLYFYGPQKTAKIYMYITDN